MVFVRTAQGSRGAPLTWSAIAALLFRLVQSCFCNGRGQKARLQVYVDDPLLALRGTYARRRRLAARYLAILIVLGVRLAYHKAQLGDQVVWIGVEIRVAAWDVHASIPLQKLQDLLSIIETMEARNVILVKELHSLTGKCTNVATLFYMWRPFLTQLWAALSETQTRVPANCVWLKQIERTLSWLRAFISGQSCTISRTFTYDASFGRRIAMTITCDASIWGYGGWIAVDDVPLAYFSDDIQSSDEVMLGHKTGDTTGQQGFEAMALLIAMRLWGHLWRSKRICLRIRSDNIGALTVFSACKGAPGAMNAVAREYSLDAAEGSYEPVVVAHLPGVTNGISDALSRRNDPRYRDNCSPPALLKHAERVFPPARPLSWWKARVNPVTPNSSKAGGVTAGWLQT